MYSAPAAPSVHDIFQHAKNTAQVPQPPINQRTKERTTNGWNHFCIPYHKHNALSNRSSSKAIEADHPIGAMVTILSLIMCPAVQVPAHASPLWWCSSLGGNCVKKNLLQLDELSELWSIPSDVRAHIFRSKCTHYAALCWMYSLCSTMYLV